MSETTQTVVDYSPRPQPTGASWVNMRVLVFVLVVAGIFGAIGYMWWEVAGTHGITQKGDAYTVDLKSMSTFPLDQKFGTVDDIPARFRELDGKKVVLIGEMWSPQSSGNRLSKFDLVYSIAKCCFTGEPQIQHFIKATPVDGNMGYYDGLVRVTGVLTIKVTKDPDGKISGLYHVAVESVEPV